MTSLAADGTGTGVDFSFFEMLLYLLAAVLLAPVAILCIECWAALLPARRAHLSGGIARPRVAVVVPAHNEEQMLAATLARLSPQVRSEDCLLIVADNCSDETARIASDGGARVIERHDEVHRGKGYALAAGIAALERESFDVLIILDADCRIEAGAIDALAMQVARTGKPAQAIYVMEHPPQASPRDEVSAFAFLLKNFIRPLGLWRLGLPCQLTGTGMALPRAALSQVKFASGNIVEDMQLGLDLALAGFAPRLCIDARVVGQLPADGLAALKQRQRWEHGHLRTILVQAPRVALLGLLRGRGAAVMMAIDLLVPPLSLLIALLGIATLVALSCAAMGMPAQPAITLSWASATLVQTLLLAWNRFGRECLPGHSILAAFAYMLWKLPMYGRFVTRPETQWVRTQR